jgi:hypothetical protein
MAKTHIPRMTASTIDLGTWNLYHQLCETRSPNDPDPGPWVINKELRIITHKTTLCSQCRDWLCHLLDSVADEDRSLKDARHALSAASRVHFDVLRAQRDRDKAVQQLAQIRKELEMARATLMQARQEQDHGANKT